MHEQLVALSRDEHTTRRRVLRFLFREAKRLEDSRLEQVRESLVGVAWPVPRRAFFNPILTFPSLDDMKELARTYPIAWLGEGGDKDWLYRTNQCVSTVLQYYLPAWTRFPTSGATDDASTGSPPRERRDQGQLAGFLETEMLLSHFVPGEEYRLGRTSWLDEPENLGMFMATGRDGADIYSGLAESALLDFRDSELPYTQESGFSSSLSYGLSESEMSHEMHWPQAGWTDFQSAVLDEIYRCLDLQRLGQRIVLLYWLRSVGKKLGRPVPLSLVWDFVDGRLGRRRLPQRLDALRLALDPASVARVLEDTAGRLRRLTSTEQSRYYRAYLKDFLILRRDLKLAYKTYEAMDCINLVEDPGQLRLSRANKSLYEFPGSSEQRPLAEHRIRAHAVLKADVRGSTEITEGLCEKGLNPASHFGLSFFEPVNKLLSDYGGEKLFVEGDAVIIGFFEREAEPPAMIVARACGLALEMLQVVSLQNLINRRHGLPRLELGLGISYSDREPNFLYDKGRRIMISDAMNRADRLSSCATALRTSGSRPGHSAFRIGVVHDVGAGTGSDHDDDVLRYNINGVALEKAAFFKLQKEISLRQVRLPEVEMEDSLFFAGYFRDLVEREHWLVLRYAPVREWNGRSVGRIAPDLGHFFELIADEALSTRVRKLAAGKEGLPLRGRGDRG
jgi:class 3 adenylate cyclase